MERNSTRARAGRGGESRRRRRGSPLVRVVRKTALWFASVAFAAGTLIVGAGFIRTTAAAPAAIPTVPPPILQTLVPAWPTLPVPSFETLIHQAQTLAPVRVSSIPTERDEASRAANTVPQDARVAVLVASFRIGTPSADVNAARRIAIANAALERRGYDVSHVDVNLGPRGRWRRVLIGRSRSIDAARRDASRVREMPEFRDARVIRVKDGEAVERAR